MLCSVRADGRWSFFVEERSGTGHPLQRWEGGGSGTPVVIGGGAQEAAARGKVGGWRGRARTQVGQDRFLEKDAFRNDTHR